MLSRKSQLLIVLALIGALTLSTSLAAQCPAVDSTTTSVMTTSIMFTIIVKNLTATAMCTTSMESAFGCGRAPTATMATRLIATNFNSVNPYCNWNCTCGIGPGPHYRTDTSDGLPVELMDFSVNE